MHGHNMRLGGRQHKAMGRGKGWQILFWVLATFLLTTAGYPVFIVFLGEWLGVKPGN